VLKDGNLPEAETLGEVSVLPLRCLPDICDRYLALAIAIALVNDAVVVVIKLVH